MKRVIAIIMSIAIAFSLTACVYTEDDIEDARQSGYEKGYEVGYEEGLEEGRDAGYNEGYDEAQWDLGSNDDSGYLGEPPSSAVYVTRTGSKYHQYWCQYVQGKSDLSYYNSATEAQSAGYSPCSVCY